MPRAKGTLGHGAIVSILIKYLHPSLHIRNKYINPQHNQRLEGCTALRLEERGISGRLQECVIVTHPDFLAEDGLIELYAARRWVKVEREGPEEGFFDVQVGPQVAEDPRPPLPLAVNTQNLDQSVIAELSVTVDIDDDNEPAPENLPTPSDNINASIFEEWGHNGVCYRRITGSFQQNPRLPNIIPVEIPSIWTIFEQFFPVSYIKEVMIPETNVFLDPPVTYGEFCLFLGLWMLMCTTHFDSRRDFWSSAPPDDFSGMRLRLGGYMSGNRFNDLCQCLFLTNHAPPSYKDPFWEVRQFMKAWNDNMSKNFMPGWVNCLDESISKWLGQYTCPGFMCIPRKPWPFGNEYHTICCGISGILYAAELVEGKDEPRDRPPKEFSELGKTVGLLLRLTRSIWHTSRLVILDSGFCVLKGIVELRKKGVFASALIKKRRYWPKFIPGDDFIAHFEVKEVGEADAIKGTLDNVPFHVFCMKEPDYVMQLMSTYGTLERMGMDRMRRFGNGQLTFKYPEVVYNHYQYRDSVDNHNASRMYPIALEEQWKTTRWPLRVFQFFFAVTEQNIRLAYTKIYNQEEVSQQKFRQMFSKALIQNPHIIADESPRRSPRDRAGRSLHSLDTIPPNRTFRQDSLVYCRYKYNRRQCVCGRQRVRTYCPCSPGTYRCVDCYVTHLHEAGVAV